MTDMQWLDGGITAVPGILGLIGSFFPKGHWINNLFDDHGELD